MKMKKKGEVVEDNFKEYTTKNGDTWEVEDDTELVRVFNFKIEEE